MSDGRVLRSVQPSAVEDLEAFLRTSCARNATAAGRLVRTERLGEYEAIGAVPDGVIYQHERIAFPSYPHEWPAEMLAAAGELTLDLFREALKEGFGLKDAHPHNILFRGASPVFVDVLSFERRDLLAGTWMGQAQFTRTFLLPLLAYRHFGMEPRDVFVHRRDGLEPETVYRWTDLRRRFSPRFLSLVTLPTWMRRVSDFGLHRRPAQARAENVTRLLASSEDQLRSLTPKAGSRAVRREGRSIYSGEQLAQKERFVQEALDLAGSRAVLDVGVSEGRYSFLAAERGASVVAIDTDAAAVGALWREAQRRNADVLPLVVDLAWPTPAAGWRNRECESFLDRVQSFGRFDMVMMLGLMHRMLCNDGIPLEELLGLAAEMTSDYALIEFVSPKDPMFSGIVRARTALRDLTVCKFEAAARRSFEIVRSAPIRGMHRCLFLLRKRV